MITVDYPALTPPVGTDDHVQGPSAAPVTLVEYGDYECPFCKQAHGIVKAVQRHMGGNLRFVFRHFPLTQIHPHAGRAAEAAEAAGAQGAFWEFHDMLFEHQDALEDHALVSYASALGLNVEQFVRELGDGTYAPRVRDHFMSGVRSGVNGTPCFFFNGRRHDTSWDVASLIAAAERAREVVMR